MEKFSISKAFNDHAIARWRLACQKVLRSKITEFLNVDKRKFIVFSIRWLFQVADTLIRLDQYEEAMDIYDEVELICTPIVHDYKCFKQMLFCRKHDLEFLITNGKDMDAIAAKRNKDKVQLNFEDFVKYRESVGKSTPEANSLFTPTTSQSSVKTLRPDVAQKKKSPTRKPATQPAPTPRKKKVSPKNISIICLDSPEDLKPKASKPKKPPAEKVLTVPRSTRKATTSKSTTDLTTPLSAPSSIRPRRMI